MERMSFNGMVPFSKTVVKYVCPHCGHIEYKHYLAPKPVCPKCEGADKGRKWEYKTALKERP